MKHDIQKFRIFRILPIFILGLFYFISDTKGQSENKGTINNNGGSFENVSSWVNTSDGTYLGSNNSNFLHTGGSIQTFVNNGTYQSSQGHIDIFKGPNSTSGSQEIGGSSRPQFFNLEFDNGSGSLINITNSEGISVSGTLNFKNGITRTIRNLHKEGAIIFRSGSSYLNGDSDNQHVNGYVSKVGNTSFLFPVGSETDLRTVEIGPPNEIETNISIAWIEGDPNTIPDPSDGNTYHNTNSVNSPISSVSKVGQWDWIPVVPSNAPILVKVSIPNLDSFASKDAIRLVGWDGSKWIDLSGGSAATGTAENSILTGHVPAGISISALGMGQTAAPLPVNLISFDANIQENTNALLNWVTAEEKNNDFFQIQHSVDGQNFESVGLIQALSASSSNSEYTFLHKLLFPEGIHYYRLKQVDLDGTYAFSRIRSIDFGQSLIKVYPNPAKDKITIEIPNANRLKILELLNTSGNRVYNSTSKKASQEIDVNKLVEGIYTIRIIYSDGEITNKKVLVIHN